ncbi:MAG: SPW repeat protein, partial [Firmicutes bacterium]|nr:SPW repeat protein [Bacillota bacterium]
PMTWRNIVLGALILIGAIWDLMSVEGHSWRMYLISLFGLYMAITPWLYGLSSHVAVLWFTLVVGALTLVLGLWQVGTATTGKPSSGRNAA